MTLYRTICLFAAVTAFAPLFSQNIYQKAKPPAEISSFDRFLSQTRQSVKITSAPEASDNVMVRRLYLDLLGRVPSPKEALAYIQSKQENKQSVLVKKLLKTEEHAMFMTMRYGDELRIKSEFPINLWPNAAFLYTRTIYDAYRNNLPYDKFASQLILSDGSNFRNGYANFFRAVPKKDSQTIADAAAQFLFGKPLKKLSVKEQKEFIKAFSGTKFKSTREWKEEIVYSVFSPEKDPRHPFMKQVLQKNEFARNGVLRLWKWIFGSDNAAPEIIDHLTEQFRKNNYDQRALLSMICTSSAYRVSSICSGDYQKMTRYGAVYPVRRLDAEVLADSIAQITGRKNSYSSVIPEPFSYYNGRAAAIPDGSVTDQFLLLFGRPSRDTGAAGERKNIITADQRLYLFNSSDLNNRLNQIFRYKLKTEKDKLGALYLLFYSRMPTPAERKSFQEMNKKWKWRLLSRMPWVLLNSKEFLYQH